MASAKNGSSKPTESENDPDRDEDGSLDVEHFPLPAALLRDAELEDEDE